MVKVKYIIPNEQAVSVISFRKDAMRKTINVSSIKSWKTYLLSLVLILLMFTFMTEMCFKLKQSHEIQLIFALIVLHSIT